MQRILLVWSLLVCACAGNASSPPDAAPAPGTFGAVCVTQSDTSTECTSGVCTNTIDQLMHSVCSQRCTTNATCPTGSKGMMCNGKGYCRP